MKIAVLVKQVPDTAAQIQIKPDQSGIVPEGIKYVLSPYDEFGVEEALRLKEKLGEGEVAALTVGPERAIEMLRNCMAMGVDQAVRIWNTEIEKIDAFGTAILLSKKLESMKPDLIWCGRQAVDDDMGVVGGVVAEKLQMPFVSLVNKFELLEDKKTVRVTRQSEGGEEVIEVALPCVLSAQKGLNDPRYPSLAGMMKAKKKEIEEVDALTLIPDIMQSVKSEMVRLEPPPPRPPGRMLKGTPEEMVKELVRALREEAKVI